MSKDELSYLVDFLGKRFDRVDRRLDAIEARVGRLEVEFEAFRHDVKGIAELARGNSERLERVELKLSA